MRDGLARQIDLLHHAQGGPVGCPAQEGEDIGSLVLVRLAGGDLDLRAQGR